MADNNEKFEEFEVDEGPQKLSQEYRIVPSYEPETPKVVRWVIKYSGGLVKSRRQANFALVGFAAAATIVSLFLFFGALRSPSQPPASEIIEVAGPEAEQTQ